MTEPNLQRPDWLSRLLDTTLQGMLPLFLLLVAFVGGTIALMITAREEEPQIVVPMADVLVSAPGLSAEQVERQIATPLEKRLYQIDGVEYVYSMSRSNQCVVTVRFYVGEDREDSLIKIYNKVYSQVDQIPAAVESWVVKPIEVDDVPIVVALLWSDDPALTGDYELRRLAEEIEHDLQSIKDTNRIDVSGGRPRQIRVELDPESLAARRTAPLEVAWALDVSNQLLPAGDVQVRDQNIVVAAGDFMGSAAELRKLVVNVVDGVPAFRSISMMSPGSAMGRPSRPTIPGLDSGRLLICCPSMPAATPPSPSRLPKRRVPTPSEWPTRWRTILAN
jgi:multidrug efflux pump subunit AcrB